MKGILLPGILESELGATSNSSKKERRSRVETIDIEKILARY
jgi:hypothetical protein